MSYDTGYNVKYLAASGNNVFKILTLDLSASSKI